MRLIWTLIVILSCQPDPGMNFENVPVIKETNDTIETSIQLDPGFSYYKGRSVESIAEEILLNGFSVVHYFVTNENEVNGIREARPEAKVATWSLGIDAGANSIEKLREEQGLDVPEMIELVKPDVHYIQTHWPDWIKSEEQLPADYTKHYAPFYREIKDEHPDLPVGIQTDIGSNKTMIKSQEWFNEFIDHSEVEGYDVMTAYEYHLGGHIYYDPPLLKKTGRIGSDSIRLSFQKRIYIDTTMMSDNLLFLTQDQELFSPSIKKINIDGNRVNL